MSTDISPENQRILDAMLFRRIEVARKTDEDEVQAIAGCVAKGIMDETRIRHVKSGGEIEAEAIQQILALVSGLPDDTPLIVDGNGTKVGARTIRVWAAFHCTPERTQ